VLITTCPHCQTSFKVTPEQLALYQGKVQCGSCTHIFVAFDYLVSVENSPATEVISTAIPTPPQTTDNVTFAIEEIEIIVDEELPPDFTEPDLPFIEDDFPPQRPKILLQSAFCFFLIVLLSGQAIFYWRSEVSSQFPEYRPYLKEGCRWLRCSVEWPRKPDLLAIVNSDFRLVGAEDLQRAELIFQIRNRSNKQLAYPRLELSLLDNQQAVVGRRLIEAEQYVPSDRKIDAGFASRQELSATLRLDLSGLTVSGYQLYLR